MDACRGIIKMGDGSFALKDFESGSVISVFGHLTFSSYGQAVERCYAKYPSCQYGHLKKINKLKASGELVKEPDADIWENLVYAGDYRGLWDGTRQEYRNVTSMDKGAATEVEIAQIDALASTYESLMSMVVK